MSRLAHFARSAVGLPSSRLTPRRGGKEGEDTVEYETPEVESQVDVTGIMGWGGWGDKDPYH